jgi:hypothetical protein
MKMNIETIDKIETICGETRHGFKFEQIMEAVSNDEGSRIAGDIYRILFGSETNLKANRDAMMESFAVYFDLSEEVDTDIIDYSEDAYGNFSAEKQVKVA